MMRNSDRLIDARYTPADLIVGTPDDDTLTGTSGNDTIDGGLGGDLMQGGLGDDYYIVRDWDDRVVEAVDAGIDTVVSSYSYFDLYNDGANIENLTLTGKGYMTGRGNLLDNVLIGNAGDTSLNGVDGDDLLLGRGGDDDLTGAVGNDTLLGGTGNDDLSGSAGDDQVSGGDGDDTAGELYYASDSDTYDGGAGVDHFWFNAQGSTVGVNWTFTSATHVVDGTTLSNFETFSAYLGDGDDYVDGRQSADSVDMVGYGGDDWLIGRDAAGSGNDLTGWTGNDTLQGGQGNDTLYGYDGNDVVDAGAGDDSVIDNSRGVDTLDGGSGVDTLTFYAYTTEGLSWTFSTGSHVFNGSNLSGFEKLDARLGLGDDYMDARAAMAARIAGSWGDDTLIGSSGWDEFRGGEGSDVIRGGAGKDIFKFDTTVGSDSVMDFRSGTDRVNVKFELLPVGDNDKSLEGRTAVEGPGHFSAGAELVIVRADIAGAITAEKAAAAIGSATSAYSNQDGVIFAVDNGVDSAVFHFMSSGRDAVVSASELSLLATLVGTASTVVSDYALSLGE